MWFIPNWQVMAEDENFFDTSENPGEQSIGMLKQIPINSRGNKTVKMRWRNRDPFTRGKYLNTYWLNSVNKDLSDTRDIDWYEQAVFPYTNAWYQAMAMPRWTDSGMPASPGDWQLSAHTYFQPADFKYAIKEPAYMVEVPPYTTCCLQLDYGVTCNWSVIEQFGNGQTL